MSKISLLRMASLLVILLGIAGCSGLRQEVRPSYRPCTSRGVIFVADGAGGFQNASTTFQRLAADEGLALAVEPVEWSHGYGRVLADQLDVSNIRESGKELACQVLRLRQSAPEADIYLVGHSAGTAVVLAAASGLPPGTVTRTLLISPAVSADYDLRPALASNREGIDVFYSSKDIGFLGLGVAVTGTTDRHWSAAAGRVGFRPQLESSADGSLFAKLRQHPWHPSVGWTGNHGGHYGGYEPKFLRAYVLPLLQPGNVEPK